MKRFATWLTLTGVLLLAGGCTVVTPKTAALREVHDTYREDFLAFNVPAPANDAHLTNGPAAVFARSLQAIRDYRLKYPGDSQELAHLKVLEGMIYLQSGRFGLAEAVKQEVMDAGGQLSSRTGRTVRDKLFADNFPLLIEGWAETKKPSGVQWQTFERVANGLRENLMQVSTRTLADPEADQGAVYVGTTAAIFYVWAFKWAAQSEEAHDGRINLDAKKKEWFQHGRDLIGRFLTEPEKSSRALEDMSQELEGRLRYLQWYHWLDQQSVHSGS